jgi:outer membrane protein assembly factor BamB
MNTPNRENRVNAELQTPARALRGRVKCALATAALNRQLAIAVNYPMKIKIILGLLAFALASTSFAETNLRWANWRGPNQDGSTTASHTPTHWNETSNVLWKVALPGKGCSTPIVWDNHIFVTAPADRQDSVLAFDWTGKELWRIQLGTESAGKHRNGSGSNASATTDGQSVFAYFKSGNFAALDFTGKIRWQTNLVEAFGRDTLYWDHGTSPVLTEKFVVMTRMHSGESWLAGFDKQTGAMLWKVARNYETPQENDHGYSTPLVIRFAGREALLLWGAERLSVHDAADGKLLWSAANFNPAGGRNWPAVATPVLVGDVAVVPYGRSDRGNPLLYGVKLGQAGELEVTEHLWKRTDTGTFVPSATVWQQNVYLVRDRGEVECLNPQTGQTIWKDNLPRASANIYGSPVIVGGKLYAVREDGALFVANVDGKFELLAENHMDERVIATPVALGNRLLVRGEKNLICLGTK